MAEQHGGKRTPRNPAPVSGPGKLSRRTDGGPAQVNAQMTGMGYGENKDFMQIQEGANMAASPKPQRAMKTPKASPMAAMGGGKAAPLFSNTQRPDEPVTSGANFGPGASASNPVSNAKKNLTNVYSRLASENPTQENLNYLALAQRMGY
tara:strand:+ start:3300 stop:3749 length:450 start_codon:yes stop_codon:yes gene_type:complete